MTNEIRISSPADVLSFIPHTLGFVPRESFVFITMRGNTLGATLRVDAPATADPDGFARSMADYLALDTPATAVLLAVFTDHPPTGGTARPFHSHIEAIIQTLETDGIPLKDAWIVTSQHWKNLLCDDTRCCPIQSLDSITDGQLNAEMIFRGSTYQNARGTNFAPFAGAPETADRIEEALPGVLAGGLEPGRALWAEALEGTTPPDTVETLELVACFQRPDLRDVMFCNVIEPERPDAEGSGYLLIGEGITPDWDRVDRAQETARQLISATPGGYRAPLLTLIGWLAYLKGQSSVAAEHFAAAIEDTPGYRLAELMNEVVGNGTIAPVAKNGATGYKKRI